MNEEVKEGFFEITSSLSDKEALVIQEALIKKLDKENCLNKELVESIINKIDNAFVVQKCKECGGEIEWITETTHSPNGDGYGTIESWAECKECGCLVEEVKDGN